MKKAYIGCLKKLRQFRKLLISEQDIKRGKLYFSWLETKTEKIQKEKDEQYIYENVVKYTLKKYKIDKYNYERLNKTLKEVVDNNYIQDGNNYIFNNADISFDDAMLITKKILLKRGNVVWIDFRIQYRERVWRNAPSNYIKKF